MATEPMLFLHGFHLQPVRGHVEKRVEQLSDIECVATVRSMTGRAGDASC